MGLTDFQEDLFDFLNRFNTTDDYEDKAEVAFIELNKVKQGKFHAYFYPDQKYLNLKLSIL